MTLAPGAGGGGTIPPGEGASGIVFNVKDYGATGNGVTDDTAAIQGAIDAAGASEGTVFLPPGQYLVSKSLSELASGAFRMDPGATLVAAASFSGSGNRGIVELVGTTDLTIEGLHTDLTGCTDASVSSLHQAGGTVLRTKVLRTTQDLGGAAQHVGIMFEGLAQGLTPSRDLLVQDVSSHNGNGDVQCYANAPSAGLAYSQVTIENTVCLIDEVVGDDRVLIAANSTDTTGVAEVSAVTVRNVKTQIAATVSSGMINGIKIDPGSYGYIHDYLIQDVDFVNESSTPFGSPVDMYLGTGSYLQDYTVRTIKGNNCGRVITRFARYSPAPQMLIEDVHINGVYDTIAGVEVYCATGAVGDETVIVRDSTLNGSLPGADYTVNGPVGVLFTGTANTGGSGLTLVDGVQINGFKTPVSNNVTEGGAIQASTWSNVHVTNSPFFNCAQGPVTVNKARFSDNPGYNPTGVQVAPAVPASGTALTNPFPFDCTVAVTDSGTGTSVAVGGITVATIAAAATVPVFVGAGQAITPTYVTAPTWAWTGH